MSERLVIVGPGRIGLALGTALHQAGALERLQYLGRSPEPPPHPIFDWSDPGVSYDVGPRAIPDDTTILLLAVPDQALAEVAQGMARAGRAGSGAAALHLSGALSLEVLTPLHAAGYSVGSIHPLQSIADPWGGAERLQGAAFAVSGEPAAEAAGRRLVGALDGRALVVSTRDRPLYHASAVTASNYLVTLAASAVRMMMDAGVSEADAVHGLVGLMRGTLDNLEHLGPGAALTGPVARGDVDTVRLHLSRLSPEDRGLYCALGLATLGLARAAGLDAARAAELERLLSAT